MPDVLEELALSGVLFETGGPSSRPLTPISRTPSPNADDELFGLSESREASPVPGTDDVPPESIGMGPGRTGVKGVIRDRDEARERDRVRKQTEIREMNKKMEKASLTGKTFFEEEAERRKQRAKEESEDEDSDDDLSRRRAAKGRTTMQFGFGGRSKLPSYGHLREVGAPGFVQAVEQVERSVWVVVHLYHPNVDRCADLDIELTALARLHGQTKFLRVRAAALGFASGGGGSAPAAELYDEDSDEEDSVDTDMLPTMLVYRGGELMFNWVRVDWEAGAAGITDLLTRHHVIAPRHADESD